MDSKKGSDRDLDQIIVNCLQSFSWIKPRSVTKKILEKVRDYMYTIPEVQNDLLRAAKLSFCIPKQALQWHLKFSSDIDSVSLVVKAMLVPIDGRPIAGHYSFNIVVDFGQDHNVEDLYVDGYVYSTDWVQFSSTFIVGWTEESDLLTNKEECVATQ